MRRAVIDALEGRSILFGGEASSKSRPDAYGRLSTNDLDIALSEFDGRIRTTVKSVISRVGALDDYLRDEATKYRRLAE